MWRRLFCVELEEVESEGRQVKREGSLIGYYYIKGEANGLASWIKHEAAALVLTPTCRGALTRAESVSRRARPAYQP
ncbi:MAG TPA: hypothetical protein VK363_07100 [Pyrinomonadaceae bacterium]|nr:hypothetical protein [Pyrinomonadaceae bacterium]